MATSHRLLQRICQPQRSRGWLAGLGLLTASYTAQAQSPVIYGLGALTRDVQTVQGDTFVAGTQGLVLLNPATGEATSPTGTIIESPIPGFPGFTTSVIRPTLITGVMAGQRLVGMDYRPNTGQLFALGYDASRAGGTLNNAGLYVLNTSTGAATPVGSALRLELGNTARVGFDFNPTVDRIRVTSAVNGANLRLNPNTGTALPADGTLRYNPGDPAATPVVAPDAFASKTPGVGAVAYLNAFIGSTNTRLFDFDELGTDSGSGGNSGILSIQNPPNAGVLNSQGRVIFRIVGGNSPGDYFAGSPKAIDFDIYYNAATGQNEAYLIEVTEPNGQGRSSTNFYSLDLTTRIATQRLRADGETTVPSVVPFEISDLAAQINAPNPPALQGQLLYALAAGNLITLDSQNPGVIRSAVNFGGGLSAGQTVVGLDFRPANGQLYALGYNAAINSAANNTQLYMVDVATGNLSAVGGPTSLNLGDATAQIGVDFNPTVDRLRVISTTGANYRLNPNTGSIVPPGTADGSLSGATGPFSATAYTNNQSGAAATTTQLVFSSNSGSFNAVLSPNLGVISPVGVNVTGTSTTTGGDFDIFNTPGTIANSGYIATASSAASPNDNLYIIDGIGAAAPTVTNAGRIGLGSNVSGLAAAIAAGSLLVWDGSESTDWATAENWTPAVVPTASNDVLIPNVTNDPVVSGPQQARTLTIEAGAMLTSANGSDLSLFGNFINNGATITGAGTGVIALVGPANQLVGGSAATSFFNLRVGPNGATLGSAASMQRLLTLNGNLTTDGQTFTLLSTPTGQGQVNNAAGTVIGTATVQRSIDGSINTQNIGYRHYASPVRAANVSDLNSSSGSGFSAILTQSYNSSPTPRSTRPFPNVMGYDQDLLATSIATDHRFNFDKGFFIPSVAFVPGNERAGLQPGHGYAVNIADDVTVDFVGELNNGPVALTGLDRSADEGAGYHFLGNPYPSALDWNTVARSANIEPALYVFKSTGQYTGFYTSFNNGMGANTGTNVLPLGQGFFVRAAAGATNGSVSFDNANRLTTYDNTPFQRGAAANRPTLTLALRTATGRGEQTVVYFEQGATAAFDAAFDAHHLAGPGAPLSLATAGQLSINGQPELTGQDVVVPLELGAATTGSYTLHVDVLNNLPAGYRTFLRDALTGTTTELTPSSRLPLSLTANTAAAAGRYALVFSTQAQVLASAPAALAQLAGVYPNPAHGTASLLLPTALRAGKATPVQVLNSLGQVVLTRTLPAGASTTLELPLTNLAPGIYTVQAQTAVGQVVKRLTVE